MVVYYHFCFCIFKKSCTCTRSCLFIKINTDYVFGINCFTIYKRCPAGKFKIRIYRLFKHNICFYTKLFKGKFKCKATAESIPIGIFVRYYRNFT